MENINDFVGGKDCICKPSSECEWSIRLKKRSDQLPNRNRLRRKVIKLIKKSVCDWDEQSVHCCDFPDVRKRNNFEAVSEIASVIFDKI